MLDFWSGYKTYLVAALTVVYAVSGFLTGNLDTDTAVQLFVTGAGLATLRNAIKV